MLSPATREAPQDAYAQGQIGSHGEVLEGAVIGIEQVEFVVLSGRMQDFLATEDHLEVTLLFPNGDCVFDPGEDGLEKADIAISVVYMAGRLSSLRKCPPSARQAVTRL